jgi:hypothetical protein
LKMMKRVKLYNFILTGLFLIFSSLSIVAQDPLQPQGVGMNQNGPPPRPNLLSELNLSQPQMRQIRRINQERRPIMQESQRRLHEANRALDEAWMKPFTAIRLMRRKFRNAFKKRRQRKWKL